MLASLAFAAVAMGVAASPHCVVMCGSPCAALTCHRRADALGFHVGRIAGYAAGGAAAAASVAALGTWTRELPALRPIWLLVHLAFLGMGLWWLLAGAMPRLLMRDTATPIRVVRRDGRPWRPRLAGLAWIAWPCGAVQAALVLSSMAEGAAGGAVVMASFAVASMPALAAAPWLWRRWRTFAGRQVPEAATTAWGYRIAGLALTLGSAWAVAIGTSTRFAAFCGG
jgi:sulfite exporter TauE/SafE